jgi:hypothetical protein
MTGQPSLFGIQQQSFTTDDHYTPKWIFDALGVVFDIDVASPPEGVPWIPTSRYFTQLDDGLLQPWHGRIWCNPPFSKPGPWADRMIDHDDGLFLCCVSKSSWMDRIWNSQAKILLLPSQTKFQRPDGLASISFPTFRAAFGTENQTALTNLGTTR